MSTKKELLSNFLSSLYFHLQTADLAYRKYLSNKIFVHAMALKKANRRIQKHILKHGSIVPKDLVEDCQMMVNHYDIWFTQFNLHKKKLKPDANDLFVFEQADSQCAFPVEAEKRLKQYYLEIKQEPEQEMVAP